MFRHPKQIFTKIVRSIPISHQFLPYIPRNTVASLAMSFAVKPFDDIIVIPVQCLTDNYSYILQDVSTGTAAVVDPVEPAKLKAALETAHIPLSNVEMILTTHKHWDHASGNKGMLELAPHASIYMGPEEGTFEFPKTVVNDGEELALGNLSIRVLHTPCHTSGHVCYLVNKGEEQLLFSGDTLFVGGCGRFFEGSAENMFPNMQKFRALAPHTHVYSGHEYTASNLRFAAYVEPENPIISAKLQWAKSVSNTHPSTIAQELDTNVFMRAGSVEALAKVRHEKDGFRG